MLLISQSEMPCPLESSFAILHSSATSLYRFHSLHHSQSNLLMFDVHLSSLLSMPLAVMIHSSSVQSPSHVLPPTVSVTYPAIVSTILLLVSAPPPSPESTALNLDIYFSHLAVSLYSLHLVSSSHLDASSSSPPLLL